MVDSILENGGEWLGGFRSLGEGAGIFEAKCGLRDGSAMHSMGESICLS